MKMCLNCGCNMFDDDMGNTDNLTLTDIAKAAKASEMNGADTLANLRASLQKIDPQQLDQKIRQLGR